MFVIEHLIGTRIADRNKKLENWERRLRAVEENAEYSYQVDSWQRLNPRPNSWGEIRNRVVIITLIGLIFSSLVGIAATAVRSYNSPESKSRRAQVAAQEKAEKEKADKESAKLAASGGEKKCGKFNLNDKVRIQYGDFVGNVGKVIGGCADNESYQVKIDDGSKADLPDGNDEKASVGGWIIDVNSDENLVKIQ